MEVKNRPIKRLNFYIQLALFIIHLGLIIYLCITLHPSQFLPHLTNWSFVLSSFYLFSILLCDTLLYFFGLKNLETFNHFIRNTFSGIAFPYCFLISIGFWIILLIGFIFPVETFLEKGRAITVDMIIINTYLHLGITIIMIVDLFFNQREKIKFSWLSGIVNTIIFIIYIISVYIEKYIFDFYPYYFLRNLNIGWMILVMFVIYGLLIVSILIYSVLSNKINKKFMRVKASGEDEKFIIGESENEENCNLIAEEE